MIWDWLFVKIKKMNGKHFSSDFWCYFYRGYCKDCKHQNDKHHDGCMICGCMTDIKGYKNTWSEKEMKRVLEDGSYIICDQCSHIIPKFIDCRYCEEDRKRDEFDVDAYLKEKYGDDKTNSNITENDKGDA